MRLLRPLLLVAAALAAYAGTRAVPFVFQDRSWIVGNLRIRELWPGPFESARPVLEWTFALNYALGGLSVAGYHAANLALHAGCGLLLFDLARRTLAATGTEAGREEAIAWWAALLFLVHPLTTEAVTLVSGRAEVLATFCWLALLDLALLGALQPRRSWRAWSLAAVACGLGMATGPMMLAAPLALLWLAHCAFPRAAAPRVVYGDAPVSPAPPRRWPLYAAGVACWSIAFALVLYRPLPSRFLDLERPVFEYLWMQLGVTWHYLGLLVWPRDLSIDYDWPATVPWRPAAAGWLAVVLLLVWLARSGRRAAALWLGLALLPLLPTSSVIPLVDVVAERRAYPTVAGFAVLVALAGAGLARRVPGRAVAALAAALALALGAATSARNRVWRDPVALWSDALARAPLKGRVFRELADGYARRGDRAGAARVVAAEAFALERALARAPRDPELLVSLGKAYALQGRVSEALTVARQAVRLAPTDPAARGELGALLLAQADAEGAVAQLEIAATLVEGRGRSIDPDTARAIWTNLGWGYASLGRSAEALRMMRRAAEGDDVTALNGLGSMLAFAGQWEEARQVLERANAKDPANPSVQRNLGWVYANLGRFAEANALLESAIVHEPDEPRAHGSLGWVRLRSGRPAGALDALAMAADLEPDNANVLIMLGIARAQLGEWQEAARVFARAVRLAPNLPLARENLNRARRREPPILPPSLP